MSYSRALLLGGVSSLATMSFFAIADISFAASAVNISVNEMARGGALFVQLADNSPTPAWAAPAQMNPDYVAGNSSAPANAASDNASGKPAWAAEATMNPDYKKDEAPQAAADVPPPPTGGQATTSYFGGSETPTNPAWAAPAAPNPDYTKTAAVPEPAAASGSAAPTREADVEACRDAVGGLAAATKLYFPISSAELGATTKAGLEKIAKAAAGCGNVVIEVGGHADSTGNVKANKALAEHRAKAVVAFLTQAGVDAAKLKAVGYGQANPITTNGTAEGRKLNRRVEFLVTGP